MKALAPLVLAALGCAAFAQTPPLPPNYPKAQYDELEVPKFDLPDPLLMSNGKRVEDAKTWSRKRRPEILKLFETHVYGRTMAARPREMTWEVTAEDRSAMDGKAIAKTVMLYFSGKKDGPAMELSVALPKSARPVPVFLLAGGKLNQLVLDRGYGIVSCRITQIQADSPDGYAKSIRGFFAPPGQTGPLDDEWGAIGAWAWALSRAMDYVETDKDIDARKVALNGVSRFGKVVMWAGAQDERFAITFSGESGCGGAVIVRRGYGETLKAMTTGRFGYWFARKLRDYAGNVNALPVDWHELVALHAPRPIYIATAEEDFWGDPRGSFLSAQNADPVYNLFGKTGLGVAEMPAVNTPVGAFIGYHNRSGKHGQNDYDWEQYLTFADRHFGQPKATPR